MSMNIKVIKNEKEYQSTLNRIDQLIDSNPGTREYDELEVLGILVEQYEKEHYHIDPPNPIDAIKFRMEQLNLKQTDLADCMGGDNRVSEVLNKKRPLTTKMIINLHKKYNIPFESLLQESESTSSPYY